MLAFVFHNLAETVNRRGSGLDWPVEPIVRLVVAAILGGLVGLEREVRGRQAGFRTNLLVCLGSALVMIVSVSFARLKWDHDSGVNVNIDPARVAYSVMAGIGFLGAGVIIKHEGSVRGLTTAAGMWCVAAIGLAVGLGHYVIAIVTAGLVVGALWSLDQLERLLPRTNYRLVTLRRPWRDGIVGETVELIRQYPDVHVVDLSFDRTADPATVDIHLEIAFASRKRHIDFERDLCGRADCQIVASRRS